MRSFIILSLFAATAYAGSLGYNYGRGHSGSLLGAGGVLIGTGVGNTLSSGGLLNSGDISGGLLSSGGVASNGGLISTGGLVGSSGLIGTGGLIGSGGTVLQSGGTVLQSGGGLISSSGSSSSRVIGVDADAILNSVPQTVEVSKQFFHFSAPEEPQQEGVTQQQLSNVLKKNLQVVFVKAPENNAATNAALQIAKQAIEQKTAIYVLSKENDASQVVAQLQQVQENVPTAPEVRFIKYRTPQDAAIATQQIQSQYDNVGGTSEVYDGGVAPVLNYASPSAVGGSILTGSSLGIGQGNSLGLGLGQGNSLGLGLGHGSSLSGVVPIGGSTLVSKSTDVSYLPSAL